MKTATRRSLQCGWRIWRGEWDYLLWGDYWTAGSTSDGLLYYTQTDNVRFKFWANELCIVLFCEFVVIF
jgi:hypothetical protein